MNLRERLVATRNGIEQLEYDYVSGKITREMFLDRIKISILKIKQEETLTKIAISGTRSRIENLIGRIEPHKEMVHCYDQDGKFITREMCLDYSGTNTEECRSCPEFALTRRALLPKE